MTGDRIANLLKLVAKPDRGLPHETIRLASVLSVGVDGRVSLNMIDRDGELSDSKPVSVWCGVAGVSVTPYQGAQIGLGFFRGDPMQPYAIGWTPVGEAGHVPHTVKHEAGVKIKFVANSAGNVEVGTAPVALAKAAALEALIRALGTFASSMAGAANIAAQVAAAQALMLALAPITDTATIRLKSQ